MNGQPAGAVGVTQNIMVPRVALGGLPSPESRHWTNGVEPAPETGGGSDDTRPVFDGKQPSSEIFSDGNVSIVVHL